MQEEDGNHLCRPGANTSEYDVAGLRSFYLPKEGEIEISFQNIFLMRFASIDWSPLISVQLIKICFTVLSTNVIRF